MASVFRDKSSNDSFSVQLQRGRPDTGEFDYLVAGEGDYLGTATLSNHGPWGVVLVSGSMSALFEASTGGSSGHASMRLDGQVLDEGSALVLDIWLDGVHTHFATGNAETAQGAVTAHQAVSALGEQHWATFYGILAPEVQSSFGSEQAFATAVRSQDGQIVSASLTGSPTTSSADGYTYLSQGVSFSVRTATGRANYTTTIYLVYEDGQWLVLGTDPPSPA
jgi:hypothetical protein